MSYSETLDTFFANFLASRQKVSDVIIKVIEGTHPWYGEYNELRQLSDSIVSCFNRIQRIVENKLKDTEKEVKRRAIAWELIQHNLINKKLEEMLKAELELDEQE